MISNEVTLRIHNDSSEDLENKEINITIQKEYIEPNINF